jgi:hypothetical protein
MSRLLKVVPEFGEGYLCRFALRIRLKLIEQLRAGEWGVCSKRSCGSPTC